MFVQADLGTADGVELFAAQAIERLGKIDILIHVLGGSGSPSGGFAVLQESHWATELNLNLLSAVRLDRALLPRMLAQGSGAVVHIVGRTMLGIHSISKIESTNRLT